MGGPGFGGYYKKPYSQLRNYNNNLSFKTSGVSYESMTARDEKMYTQTEFYKNIQLDNTKEEREWERKAKMQKKNIMIKTKY